MSILTVAVFYGSTPVKSITKVKSKDGEEIDKTILEYPFVERVRRCHRNDLENILPFVLLGLLYLATDPDPNIASIILRIFTASRFFHTIVYLFAIPQPTSFSDPAGSEVTIKAYCSTHETSA
ncbi:Microsomal glutathione S-transferase 1 [Bulinus truncatus]|nr:Microsomal glutathione S-transferase 1 [Bulinus truncatus]